jgi:hypothetical protein
MAHPNDMVSVAHIHVAAPDQVSKNDAKKLNGTDRKGKNSENLHKVNFKSVAKLSLGLRTARMATEVVGAYTGDRLTQRRVTTAMTVAQYGIGIKVAGGFGMFYAAGDLAFRGLMQNNEITLNNQKAGFLRDLSGNNARNHGRNRGEKL